jgi:hypothetical protein
MTEFELEAVKCLQHCTFPVASFDKRFVRGLSGLETITEKEAPQVWRLFVRYRRQISTPNKAALLQMAEELSAPDFRKQAASARAQREIDELKRRYESACKPSEKP